METKAFCIFPVFSVPGWLRRCGTFYKENPRSAVLATEMFMLGKVTTFSCSLTIFILSTSVFVFYVSGYMLQMIEPLAFLVKNKIEQQQGSLLMPCLDRMQALAGSEPQ